jgi:Flp pilus assembly protein TadD
VVSDSVSFIADRLESSSLQIAIRMEQGGRLDEAIRFLEQSIGKSPDAPSLYNLLAIVLRRERADLRRAGQLLQKAVDLAPENPASAQNLQMVLSKRALAKR